MVSKKRLRIRGGTAFVSCKISDDAITFYSGKDAAGASQTVTYTYKGEIPVGVGDMNWFSFEGDAAAGEYKYLLLLPAEDDEGAAPLHFHCLYGSSSFEALTGAGFDWFPQMILQDQATAKIKVEIDGLLEEM
jgi:hypothetical protein